MASKITVGKIVASATDTKWSQAYHAGGFTAVLSVSKEKPDEDQTLQSIGKKLLDTLVSEYFTLTTKDLQTVRSAVETTMAKEPENAEVSLIVAAVVKNVLYAVVANSGRVLLKRGEKTGMLLGLKPGESEKIASVSGFLENGDIIVLNTPAFGEVFPHDQLEEVLGNKNAEELAEAIAPKVHEAQNGAASALVFSFHEDEAALSEEAVAEKPAMKINEPMARKDEHEEEVREEMAKELPGFEKPLPENTKPKGGFSHRQKLFLTITVILGIVLIGSVFVFLNRQQEAKQQALFQQLYMPAKTKFDEAQGLMDLNKSLAIEDLQSAQDQLTAAKSKFPDNSSEEKQILSLLSQVRTSLDNAKKIPLLSAQKAPDNASPLLSFAAKHSAGAYITQDTTNFYTADNTAITQYDKKTNASKKLITNGTDWKQIGGFDTYFGNFYVLDTKDGINKYVSGGGGYGKNSYFTGSAPDLSKAVSLSIDSSIYILTSDGTIMKYTKGAQDSFSVTGLSMPFKSPTEILTSADLDNLYVLDNGNSRIVVLKKDGSFIAQYASDQIHSATTIDVSEKNKKLYFLSGGTVYQLDLK